MNVKELPKVELHLHLDGSLSFELVKSMRPELTATEYREEFMAPVKCGDLSEFLEHTRSSLELLQTKQALEDTVRDLCKQLRKDRIVYAEIRFAPLLHLRRDLKSEQVVHIVEQTLREESKEHSLEARLILCTLRSFSEDESMKTVELVNQFKGSLVCGFDVAGYDPGFPVLRHRPAFDFARRNDIPCTAHAGEAFGPSSVSESMDQFHVRRIGHGVRSIEDADLMERLKREQVHLEVCPSSNIQVNVFDSMADHPVDQFYRHGISLSINTDNRTLSDITLSEEYLKMHQTFGWGKEHFLHSNIHALEAAFLPSELKDQLKMRIEKMYAGI